MKVSMTYGSSTLRPHLDTMFGHRYTGIFFHMPTGLMLVVITPAWEGAPHCDPLRRTLQPNICVHPITLILGF